MKKGGTEVLDQSAYAKALPAVHKNLEKSKNKGKIANQNIYNNSTNNKKELKALVQILKKSSPPIS